MFIRNNISPLTKTKSISLLKRIALLCFGLLMISAEHISAQVISTSGAVSINNTSGTVIVTNTLENNSGSTFDNAGTLTTTTITNAGVLQNNGTYNVSSTFTNTGTFTPGTSTVNYNNAAGSQSVTALNYHNLTISNSSGATTLSGTIGVKGTFTPSAGALTSAGTSTVNFNNTTGGQSIPAFNYYNLTSSNASGVNTLVGSIGVGNVFAPSAGALTSTGTSTVNFNKSTGGQSIPAFNYYNLTSSNTSGVNTLISTVGVANIFTPSAFTSAGSSTVDFNGTGSQTISVFAYNNFTLSSNRGGGVVTLASGTITVSGNGTSTASNLSYSTTGNTFDYNSASAQSVAGITYGVLSFTNAGTKTINSTVNVNVNMTVNSGADVLVDVAGILTVNGDITNDGILTNDGSITLP